MSSDWSCQGCGFKWRDFGMYNFFDAKATKTMTLKSQIVLKSYLPLIILYSRTAQAKLFVVIPSLLAQNYDWSFREGLTSLIQTK